MSVSKDPSGTDRETVGTWHITSNDVRDLISSLNHYCFRASVDRFEATYAPFNAPAEPAASPHDSMHDYLRCINWSLKEAQLRIIDTRLRLEGTTRAGSLLIDPPYTFKYLIRILTDFADSIAWQLLNQDLSWVRSQFHEPRSHSDLVNHNWESIEQILGQWNEDPDQFALATDITSFMQVGDVFLRNVTTGQASAIEVKTGEANEQVIGILSSANVEEFTERLNAFVAGSAKPEHAFKQVERNLKQQSLITSSRLYQESGNSMRVDLKTQLTVQVSETELDDQWFAVVRDFARNLADLEDAANGVIDECLFFEYGNAPHTMKRDLFFRWQLSKRLGLSLEEEELAKLPVFDVAQMTALPCFVPQSTNLLKLGEELQPPLLALDHYLLVYLHVPLLAQMLAKYGVKLEIRNMKTGEKKFGDPITRAVFGANRLPYLSPDAPGTSMRMAVLGGITSRILFNFLSPFSLVDMLTTFIAESLSVGTLNNPGDKSK